MLNQFSLSAHYPFHEQFINFHFAIFSFRSELVCDLHNSLGIRTEYVIIIVSKQINHVALLTGQCNTKHGRNYGAQQRSFRCKRSEKSAVKVSTFLILVLFIIQNYI